MDEQISLAELQRQSAGEWQREQELEREALLAKERERAREREVARQREREADARRKEQALQLYPKPCKCTSIFICHYERTSVSKVVNILQ